MITKTYGEIADGLKTTRDFFSFVDALTPMREAVLGLRLRKLLKAEQEADKQRALIETLTAALVDCEDYFDNRADADCDEEGFIPNDEMRLLQPVRRALAAAKQEGF